MADRIPSCRGAGCCQGDKPEACDCGRPIVEWPPLNRHTAALAAALVALGALLSALAQTGATP